MSYSLTQKSESISDYDFLQLLVAVKYLDGEESVASNSRLQNDLYCIYSEWENDPIKKGLFSKVVFENVKVNEEKKKIDLEGAFHRLYLEQSILKNYTDGELGYIANIDKDTANHVISEYEKVELSCMDFLNDKLKERDYSDSNNKEKVKV